VGVLVVDEPLVDEGLELVLTVLGGVLEDEVEQELVAAELVGLDGVVDADPEVDEREDLVADLHHHLLHPHVGVDEGLVVLLVHPLLVGLADQYLGLHGPDQGQGGRPQLVQAEAEPEGVIDHPDAGVEGGGLVVFAGELRPDLELDGLDLHLLVSSRRCAAPASARGHGARCSGPPPAS
jgi:hypothetical protein